MIFFHILANTSSLKIEFDNKINEIEDKIAKRVELLKCLFDDYHVQLLNRLKVYENELKKYRFRFNY